MTNATEQVTRMTPAGVLSAKDWAAIWMAAFILIVLLLTYLVVVIRRAMDIDKHALPQRSPSSNTTVFTLTSEDAEQGAARPGAARPGAARPGPPSYSAVLSTEQEQTARPGRARMQSSSGEEDGRRQQHKTRQGKKQHNKGRHARPKQ